MTRDDSRELLKKAFIEAMYEKYSEELSVCNENAECSKEHKKRIRQIISGSSIVTSRKRFTKKTVVVLLIAAALLLAGCTVYVSREQIENFFVEIYDEYIVGKFDNGKEENVSEIIDVYTVGYVFEGFVLQKETIRNHSVSCIWQNETGDIIGFQQNIYDNAVYYFDGEKGKATTFKCGDYTVYFRSSDPWYTYLWDNGTYVFELSMTYEFSEEEVIKIIQSIKVKQ